MPYNADNPDNADNGMQYNAAGAANAMQNNAAEAAKAMQYKAGSADNAMQYNAEKSSIRHFNLIFAPPEIGTD